MLEIEDDINFDFDYSNNELVNLKSPINDSENENENNTSFDNSELKNTLKKEAEKYFSCSKCSKIVSDTRVCQKCDNFYCGDCSCTLSKCPTCESTKKMEKDESIDSVVSEIFYDGKVVEENINFGILSAGSLKN
jgi:hypothetical protein